MSEWDNPVLLDGEDSKFFSRRNKPAIISGGACAGAVAFCLANFFDGVYAEATQLQMRRDALLAMNCTLPAGEDSAFCGFVDVPAVPHYMPWASYDRQEEPAQRVFSVIERRFGEPGLDPKTGESVRGACLTMFFNSLKFAEDGSLPKKIVSRPDSENNEGSITRACAVEPFREGPGAPAPRG